VLVIFVDVENAGFDETGTILPFGGESQAQLAVDLPTSN
jgi:hypothetical protein